MLIKGFFLLSVVLQSLAVLNLNGPPRGWNSYDAYTCTVTEDEVRQSAQHIAKYLKPSGYDYVVIDYEWYRPGTGQFECCGSWEDLHMDAFGRLIPSPDRFPSSKNGTGFKVLADYVHSLGLKFGIHIMRGIPRAALQKNTPIFGTSSTAAQVADINLPCKWCVDMWGVKNTTLGQAYYDSLIELYAEWGVDFIKMDCVFGQPEYLWDIQSMAKSIVHSKHEFAFSLSPGSDATASEAMEIYKDVTMYRVTDDVWDNWPILKLHFDRLPQFMKLVGRPSFPDSDMLPLGYLSVRGGMGPARYCRLSQQEQQTLMSLWIITRSPLIFGGDMMKLGNDTDLLHLLTNSEALQISKSVYEQRQVRSGPLHQIWSANTKNSEILYVALFNLEDVTAHVTMRWKELGILRKKCSVRQVWEKKNLGIITDVFETDLAPHASMIISISGCH
eukprot:TRINITY_DN5324_c0_g1_i1.p1 TRINITY_DN5324_c0_g1~~TRINITY_DN5324_c0_g1_i1.p1  ORF type:complete len:444 (-),score=110.57 TRINITY_DN5324_c0_g1_i1:21-1352(-)